MDSTQFNNKGKFGELTNDYKLISEEKAAGAPQTVIDAIVDAAIINNDGISPNADYEETQKIINEIILNTIMMDRWEFTMAESEEIIRIANLCPFILGPSVYEARSLTNFIDAELIFDDEEICNNASAFRTKNINEHTKGKNAIIYPNPASNRITVNISIEEKIVGEFQIFNSFGIKVLSRPITNKNDLMDLDIHYLANGIYNCHIVMNNLDQIIGKLTIVH